MIKIWFPEVLEELKNAVRVQGSPNSLIEQLISINPQINGKIDHLRKEKGLGSQFRKCVYCGNRYVSESRVTIRAMLYALKRVEVINDEHLNKLEKAWRAYQKFYRLDNRGQSKSKGS